MMEKVWGESRKHGPGFLASLTHITCNQSMISMQCYWYVCVNDVCVAAPLCWRSWWSCWRARLRCRSKCLEGRASSWLDTCSRRSGIRSLRCMSYVFVVWRIRRIIRITFWLPLYSCLSAVHSVACFSGTDRCFYYVLQPISIIEFRQNNNNIYL